jgi:thiol-disulfide isomerase/thioredoxin
MTLKRIGLALTALAAALVAAPVIRAADISPSVGAEAPEVAPSKWLNARGEMSWSELEGRLIIVERWATWCPPCRESIPHLNKLHEEYAEKGLTIIGISDEASNVVEPFIGKMNMQYLVAIDSRSAYQTPTIPRAWLVTPDGKVAWEGGPTGLTNAMIEEHLKDVQLAPKFTLPKELKRAQAALDRSSFGSGIKELESYLKSPRDEEVAKVARETLTTVQKYGETRLERAMKLKESGYASDFMAALTKIQIEFKGSDVGEKAKATTDELKKDKDFKVELQACEIFDRASDLIRQKKMKQAAPLLKALVDEKKFAEVKIRAQAEKKLASIKPYI